ncbi:hypothetical protein VKT23_001580 [Stygiomarasmius scandens]|uniref:Mediator of RNA polymerase II transcription subunit 21 n=1 Tax=Marasmiellus scandens TaxID=2682957 RepID=A0ABR1K1Y0_9AGAR
MSTIPNTIVPTPPIPSGNESYDETLSKIQSAETSYNAICTQALDTIRTLLKEYGELDANDRDELLRILPLIEGQKDKILATISQAEDTLESEETDSEGGAATNGAYMDTMNSFTETVQELDKHLVALTTVIGRSALGVQRDSQ